MKHKFYFFLAAICCMIMATVSQMAMANPTVTEKGIQYELIDNTSNLEICKCDPSVRGDVDLPAYVELLKKRPVVKITSWAFSPLDLETNLATPYTLTEIEKQAFSGAKGLKTIILNMGITEIGEKAFDGCENLSKINLPMTIAGIKRYTFNECTSLKEIYIPKNILYISDGAFNECKKLETVQGMAGVTSIGFFAFYQCSNLKSVDLSSATSLNSIGEDAFHACGKLKKITLPPNLSEIGRYAFSFSGLDTVINLSTTPQKIYANVFYGNVLKFNTLIVPKGCREKYQKADVWKDFGTIIELGEQGAPDPYSPVPSGKHKIGDLYYSLSTNQEAMVVADASYTTGLSGSLRVPSSVTYNGYIYTVTSVDKQAFKQCTLLTDVYLPNTITHIGDEAFSGCSKLFGGTLLPSNVTSLGNGVFEGCVALSGSIAMPEAITVVPDNCFKECEKLYNVKLSPVTTEIGNRAFYGCYALHTVTFPPSLSSIQYYSFSGCKNIESIICECTTPPSYILNYSFHATNLPENCIVYVPRGHLTDYKEDANWKYWQKLREIGSNEKLKYGDVYYQLKDDGTAYVTYEVKNSEDNYKSLSGEVTVADFVPYQGMDYKVISIGSGAFKNCKGMTKVNLPEHLEEISGEAFMNCTALEDAHIPYNVVWLNNSAFEGSALFNNNKDKDGAVYYDNCLLYYTLNNVSGTYTVKKGTRMIAARVFEGDEKITELIVPEGVRRVLTNSIESMYGLQTLRLPSTLDFIGVNFCNDCFYLTKIYNFRKKPFDLSENNCFDNVNQAKCTLYVPYGSSNEYNKAVEWKDFTVVEMGQSFTVTFEDWNGYVLKTETVLEGEDANKPDEDPSREGYNFIGWSPSYENVKSNLTITAQYEPKKFTVRFYDEDKTTLLKQEEVEYGLSAIAPEPPTHEGFDFFAWDNYFDVVTSDMDIYAVYTKSQYWIYFEDGDGNVFYSIQREHGETMSVLVPNGDDEALKKDCHSFTGKWLSSATGTLMTSKEVADAIITGEVTYTAQFELNYYYVKSNVSHGTVKILEDGIDMDHVACGTVLHIEPVPDEGYEFDGWVFEYDPEAGITITEDFWFSGNCKVKMCTVQFIDWNDTELKKETVEYGQSASAPDDPVRDGYTFIGWDQDYKNVTGDMTVKAQYTINQYTVRFLNWDGTELSKQEVEYGNSAIAPDDPTREGYIFIKWDKSFSFIHSDLIVTAVYKFIEKDGFCGPKLEWTYDADTYTLIITGEGEMFDYYVPEFGEESYPAPWKSCNIEQIILPEGMTSIGNDAFNSCQISLISIPEKVTKIGNDAFRYTGLTEITIPESVTTIGWGAFRECDQLKEAILPDNLTEIPSNLFNWCVALESVHMPKELTLIGEEAFKNCDNLTSIEIPASVVEIGKEAFFETSLSEIHCFAITPPSLGILVFEDVDVANCKLYVPKDAIETYKATDVWKDFDIQELVTHTVTFVDYDGETILKSEEVADGESATAPADPVREGYNFTGWDKAFDAVTEDMTVKALYEEATVYFTVTYYDWDLTILGTETVEEGKDAQGLNPEPTREGYTFTGWSKPLTNITSDLSVQAQYEVAKVYFTVTYYDWDLTILGTEKVEEGHDAQGLNPEPTREGYIFTGWSKPLTNITSDLSVQATYKENPGTGIDEAEAAKLGGSTKLLRDGVLYIERNGQLYTVTGAEVK